MKKIFTLMLLLMMVGAFSISSFALGEVPATTESLGTLYDNYAPSPDINDDIPRVTVDDATNWIDKKGNDIIILIQRIAQYAAIFIFVLGAIVAMFGSLGNARTAGMGLWAMGLSLVLFAFAMFAQEIMAAFLSWVGN